MDGSNPRPTLGELTLLFAYLSENHRRDRSAASQLIRVYTAICLAHRG